MNKLVRTLNKLERLPNWVPSLLLNRMIPYTGTSKLKFEVITTSRLVVSMNNHKKVRNHIGQIHAMAMSLLGETASGIVLAMNIPDGSIILLKSYNLKFVRRSSGAMKAEAWLTPEQQNQIQQLPKGEIAIPVKITDSTGHEPLLVEAVWAWRQKSSL